MLCKLLLFSSWSISPRRLSPDSVVQHHMKLSDRLVCCRCPDPSLQPIFGSLWVGGRPGGAFGLFVGAKPGVSSLRWPRLGIPLRSPRLRGLQGEREIKSEKIIQWDNGHDQTNWLTWNILSGLLLTHPRILFPLFPLFVNSFVNIHQLHPLQVNTQVETSQGSQAGLWLHINQRRYIKSYLRVFLRKVGLSRL